ncbi:uncharacterized protein LOC134283717 [Saccostrea cucullata]|uniref:uncharacterized protein LOC134283717 n=1 Tax=Saccostrea cuccullata TaxID=36930 RepID=UPI002ED3F8F8
MIQFPLPLSNTTNHPLPLNIFFFVISLNFCALFHCFEFLLISSQLCIFRHSDVVQRGSTQPACLQPATDEEEGAHCPVLSRGPHWPRRSVDLTETYSSILGSKDRLRPHMEERICGMMQPSIPSPLKRSLPT